MTVPIVDFRNFIFNLGNFSLNIKLFFLKFIFLHPTTILNAVACDCAFEGIPDDMWVTISVFMNFLNGVLHPRSVFGLFMHFSQNLQHIGNK